MPALTCSLTKPSDRLKFVVDVEEVTLKESAT